MLEENTTSLGSQRVKIGRRLDLASNELVDDVLLDRSDFTAGIGVFGREASYTSQLVAASAIQAGFDYLILDFSGSYRTLIYSQSGVRVLRFGLDFGLDLFSGEGLEFAEYAQLLFLAFHQACRIPFSLSSLFTEVVLTAHEQAEAEDRGLTAGEVVGCIGEWLDQKMRRASQYKLETLREVMGRLSSRKTSESLSLPPSLPISRLFHGLTVVELHGFASYEFRSFLQAMFIVKLLAYFAAGGKRAVNGVILLDEPQHLFPNRRDLPLQLREPHFQYHLIDLRRAGVSLHLSSTFPEEVDSLVMKQVGTRVFHESPEGWSLPRSVTTADRNFVARMHPPEALLCRWSGEACPMIVDRPEWVFRPQPTDAEVEASLLRVGYPIKEIREEMEAKVGREDFELDFGGEASSAYLLLKALRDFDHVTEVALAWTLTTVPAEKARPLVNLLRRLGYIREKKGRKSTFLKLTMRGLKAVKQWERSHPTLEKLSESEKEE